MRTVLAADKPRPYKGVGRPAEYSSENVRQLWFRWSNMPKWVGALRFTPQAARELRATFVVMTHAVRVGASLEDASESRTYEKRHVTCYELSEVEQELLDFLVVLACVYGNVRGKRVKITRCAITGALMYAGPTNPRKYISPAAAELDLRIQQMRTLLSKTVFTPQEAKDFRGELYSLSCLANSKKLLLSVY